MATRSSFPEGAAVLEPEELDVAILGTMEIESGEEVLAYSYERLIKVFASLDQGSMSEEEAREWVDFNTVRAIPYMGPRKPILIYELHNV